MKAANLPPFMWGEAVCHSVYILNRLPIRALKGRTPYEAWNGMKPDLSHIKMFGCIAYMKVPAVQVRKLKDRGKAVVQLGKEPGTMGSLLYDLKTGTVHVSRDVVVRENKFWPWEGDKEPEVWFPESFTVVSSISNGKDNAETEEVPMTLEQLVATGTPGSSAENSDMASENSSEPEDSDHWKSCI